MFKKVIIVIIFICASLFTFMTTKENRDLKKRMDIASERLNYVYWVQKQGDDGVKDILTEYGIRVSALEYNWDVNVEQKIKRAMTLIPIAFAKG